VEPNSTYRVAFWAKVLSGAGHVRSNFYDGPRYDFPQVPIDLTSDGEWHQYEVLLTTGEFPRSAHPALRLWAIGGVQQVSIDDISVEPAAGEAARPAPEARVGAMESL
jgi:hypothetical protein